MVGDGFGRRVRQVRERAGMSQEALAGLAEIDRTSLARIEGGADPRVSHAGALYEALRERLTDLSAAWFLTGSGTPPAGRVGASVNPSRRRFIRHAAVVPATLAFPVAARFDLERFIAPELDLSGAEALTDDLLGQWYTVRPGTLLPPVLGHLENLEQYLPGPRALSVVFARTALLAAHTLGKADGPEHRAYRYYAMAETAARDAGDRPLLAVILASRSALHSTVARGPREGDPQVAIQLLDQAVEAAPPTGRVRTEVFARRAEERALAGDREGALRDLDAAEAALGEPADGPGRIYFGARQPAELGAIRGNVELLLGQNREAITTLDMTLAGMDSRLMQWRAAVLADQGAAFARAGELDAAVDRLERALQMARQAGDHVTRVAGVRTRDLGGYESEPAVRRLDERLTATL